MDLRTFKLLEAAAIYAQYLLELDKQCWFNKLGRPIKVAAVAKGHPARPNLKGRPSLVLQAKFGDKSHKRHKKSGNISESSPEFRSLTELWGGTLVLRPINPMKAKSHRPRINIDPLSAFSVCASGRRPEQNSKLQTQFEKAMKFFLKMFKERYKDNYTENEVRSFSKNMLGRLSCVVMVVDSSIKPTDGAVEIEVQSSI